MFLCSTCESRNVIFPCCAYDKGGRVWIEFEFSFSIVTKISLTLENINITKLNSTIVMFCEKIISYNFLASISQHILHRYQCFLWFQILPLHQNILSWPVLNQSGLTCIIIVQSSIIDNETSAQEWRSVTSETYFPSWVALLLSSVLSPTICDRTTLPYHLFIHVKVLDK